MVLQCRPICRTVSDAVYLLDVIAGYDPRDAATIEASKFFPNGGYKQFLRRDGLRGKRLGIVRHPFLEKIHDSAESASFKHHVDKIRLEINTAIITVGINEGGSRN